MKNIILISIDNLRYDCIGYQPDKRELKKYDVLKYLETPTLDSLAEKSLCFTQCMSTNTYTTSAHASVFTGLYPPRHGIKAFFETKLSKDVYTIAEILKVFGYETILSTDVIELFSLLDLHRGFNHIYCLEDDKLFSDLTSMKDKNIFLFIHVFDVHEPYLFSEYEISQDYNHEYYEAMDALYRYFNVSKDKIPQDKPHYLWGNLWQTLGSREIEYLLPLFVKGVTKFDKGRFSWIMSRLREAGLTDDSLIVIFSDHGEGKLNNDHPKNFSHAGQAYDNIVRVPLMIYHEDLERRISNNLVSLVDILPTVIEVSTNKKVEEVLPYKLDGLNLLSSEERLFTYMEYWQSRSPAIVFDEKEIDKRCKGVCHADVETILVQRCVRTKNKKIMFFGKPEQFQREEIYNLPNEDFVNMLYRYLLYRKGEDNGLKFHTERLNSGMIDKIEVLGSFLKSEEYREKHKLIVYDIDNDPYEEHPKEFLHDKFIQIFETYLENDQKTFEVNLREDYFKKFIDESIYNALAFIFDLETKAVETEKIRL